MMTYHPLDELTVEQLALAARACDVHRQAQAKRSEREPDNLSLKADIRDLRIAGDLLKRAQEQEMFGDE
jgi:hypothetical protein